MGSIVLKIGAQIKPQSQLAELDKTIQAFGQVIILKELMMNNYYREHKIGTIIRTFIHRPLVTSEA